MSLWAATAAAMDEAANVPPGRLAWTVGGLRCYVAERQFAITSPELPTLVYALPGVDIGALS